MTQTLIKFFRFIIVGGFGTTAHYCTLISLTEMIKLDPVLSSGVGFIVGALINYALNYRFTFKSKTRHVIALPKFLVVATITGTANVFIVQIGIDRLQLHYLVSQAISTIIIFIINFIINLFWTFKETERNAN